MRIGITGWQGFIGSYLRNKIEEPILFDGDMKKLGDVKTFTKDCERVYHLAGLNRETEGKILENNILSTGNLVLALKLQKIKPEIIFVSSKQVEWNPDSEYGLTKSIEEEIIKKADKWSIFRVPNVYGPGGVPFYNSVVATFTYQIAHGQKVTVNNPSDSREFIFIGDLIDNLMKPELSAFVHPKGEIMSIGEIYEYLTSRLGEHKNLKKCLDYYLKDKSNVSST